MKHACIAFALAVTMTGPALAQSTSNERPLVVRLLAPPAPAPTPVSTMLLQGDGLVERAPDLAKLAISIVTNDDSAIVSSSKNNDIYNTFKTRTAGLGLASDAIGTTAYNVVFVPHPPRGLPPEQQQPRYGYVTTRSMLVSITPIENLGQVIDAATAAGVTNVGAITFDLKDRKSAYNAALAAAMNDAKTTAQMLAATGGFTIVRIQTLTVTSQNVPLTTISRLSVMSSMAAAPTPTQIDANGPISISAHITVTYVIK